MSTNTEPISVSALNRYIKTRLEKDDVLSEVVLFGELSNVKYHRASGHWYFSVKDDKASISAGLFKSYAERLSFELKDGQAVYLFGQVTVYEKNGSYQLSVKKAILDGDGNLNRRLEQLKEKLLKEGIFKTESTRKALVPYPKKVCLVTSRTGAVIEDMVRTIRERTPHLDIILIPANVQGVLSVSSIVDALDKAYQRDDIDVIIVGRGGGSIEDLWSFNEEAVVRKIAESPVPIISAVGHETDTTLSDYAADYRAGTPSIGAAMICETNESIFLDLESKKSLLRSNLTRFFNQKKSRLAYVLKNTVFLDKNLLLGQYYQNVDENHLKLEQAMRNFVNSKQLIFEKNTQKLESLSPLAVLSRGYTYVTSDNGKIVANAKEVEVNDVLKLHFSDGVVTAQITDRESKINE